MKKIVHFTAVLLAAALLVTGAAMGDTIDQTDGANQLGGPSLGKVHVLSVPLKAPIVSSNTYVLAELPVGAYVLGAGAHAADLSTTNATVNIYNGTSGSTCASAVSTNLAVNSTGTPVFAWEGGAVTDSTEFYGIKVSANQTAGTVWLDLLVMQP